MKIRYKRSVKASSGGMDYADLKGMEFKKARDILTKDGFSEHEYGDKDDNNGYAVYRKGNKEVELQYRWTPGKRKNEYHAGKVTNVYVDDDINASCGKKSVKSSCGRKSVKSASGSIKNKSRNVQVYFWQNNAYNAVVFTDGEYWIVFDGDSNGKFDGSVDLYDDGAVSELKSYIKNADFNSFDEMYNEFSQDQGSMSPAVGDNFGREFDKNELTKVGTIYEGKAEASTGNKHRSKIMAGPGAGYTIKWTLDKIDNVNTFNVVDVSRMDSYGTVTVTADCDIDVTVTIDSAWSYSYGFSDPIENVPAKITRIIFDMYTPDWSFLDPNDYENGEDDEAYQEAVESAIYALTEEDAIKVLEDEAWETIKGDEYIYGGGYTHSTYDGTLNEIDGDYNWVDIKITDEAIINYIDQSVTGDNRSTNYVLINYDEEIIDAFDNLEDAEAVANDLVSTGAEDYIEIWEEEDVMGPTGEFNLDSSNSTFITRVSRDSEYDEELPWE